MSRSKRKTKIFRISSAESEKQDKRLWNRKFRKVCKKLIRQEKELPNNIKAVTDAWSDSKDGKRFRVNTKIYEKIEFLTSSIINLFKVEI